MNRVALICTIHQEIGAATIVELHQLLARIKPQVIFAEVPADAFDDVFMNCTRANLESRAVNRYRERQDVQIVPIDLPTPDRSFFEGYDGLCSVIRSRSPQYRQLMTQDRHHIWSYGFAYLNSDYCSQHWAQTYAEMERVVHQMGDPRWEAILKDFQEKNAARDEAMVEAIRRYCSIHNPDRSVFLVGAAHRQSLIELFNEQEVRADVQLECDLSH